MVNTAQKTIGISIAILLFIPLIAMQFTKEVNWSGSDFLIMGLLLAVTGFGCEFLSRKVIEQKTKIALIVGIVALFLLIWAELAVGIFNSPISGS